MDIASHKAVDIQTMNSKTEHPIGFIDSGSGGLSIWKSVVTLLPYESTLYIGDHAYIPYGKKSVSFIRSRVERLIAFLIKRSVKLIVIACNTATVAGIEYYRNKYPDIPIIGVVPVIKTAVAVTKNQSIVVLATDFTAQSLYYKEMINKYAKNCTVVSIGASELVTIIEQKDKLEVLIRDVITQKLALENVRGFDTVVLGCTHFPLIRDQLARLFGEHVTILDSGSAVANQVQRILTNNSLLNSSNTKSRYDFFSTGEIEKVNSVVSSLMSDTIHFAYVDI